MSVLISRSDLTPSEDSAVSVIEEILSNGGYPADNLLLRRAENYLTIGSPDVSPFCRLKLTGILPYIELCICDPVDIDRLSAIPVYSGLLQSTKKFTRFYLRTAEDVGKYSDGLKAAFCYINPAFRVRRTVKLPGDGLSDDLREFFSKMEAYSSASKKFDITADEITFFSAYVDGLTARGLDWSKVDPDRMSDGAIKARGGRIKLQGKKTYMSYTKPGRALSLTAENLSLEKYIDLLKYWFSDCMENRDIYSL